MEITGGSRRRQAIPGRPEIPTDGLDELVQELLRFAEGSSSADARHAPGEVLLNVLVGDVRCILLRAMNPRSKGALSARETEIAQLVAAGNSNKEIAEMLHISTWTVGGYLRRIYGKLGVDCRAAMVTQAHALGICASEGIR